MHVLPVCLLVYLTSLPAPSVCLLIWPVCLLHLSFGLSTRLSAPLVYWSTVSDKTVCSSCMLVYLTRLSAPPVCWYIWQDCLLLLYVGISDKTVCSSCMLVYLTRLSAPPVCWSIWQVCLLQLSVGLSDQYVCSVCPFCPGTEPYKFFFCNTITMIRMSWCGRHGCSTWRTCRTCSRCSTAPSTSSSTCSSIPHSSSRLYAACPPLRWSV
jgi:hypothetical protein